MAEQTSRPARAAAFLLGVLRSCGRHQIGYLAGSISFFVVLGMVPFLFAATALAGQLLGEIDDERLTEVLRWRLPQEIAEAVVERTHALRSVDHLLFLYLGAGMALYSASRAIKAIMRALNTINGVSEDRPAWKRGLIGLAATLIAALFWIVALGLVLGTLPLMRFLPGPLAHVVAWLRLPLAALLAMTLFSFFYSALPAHHQRVRWLSPGGVVAVLLWLAASQAFSMYVAHSGEFGALYGTLGGLIALLMWIWLSAQVLLFGAEINAQRASGPSPKGPLRPAAS